MAKKEYKVTDQVIIRNGANVEKGEIKKISKDKVGETIYLVNGEWYYYKDIRPRKFPSLKPTANQLQIIKKTYPIFKEENISIFYETNTRFAFHYKKKDQEGNLMYKNGDFSPMTQKEAERLVYSIN